MRSTWGRAANIEFSGFGDCPSNVAISMAGWIAINLATYTGQGGSTSVGYSGYAWTRMRLDPGLSGGASTDSFRAQVIHQTGYALGFQNEYDRADNPRNSGCPVADINHVNDTGWNFGTMFDYLSIMNFAYDQGCPPSRTLPQPFRLSAYDTIGIQNAYGRHSPGQLVAQSGGCLNIPMPYSPGGVLQTYECQQNGSNSLWQFSPNDSQVFAPWFAAYIDVPWAASWPGVQLDANNRNAPVSGNQIWHPFYGYEIRGIGETCLDIPNANIANGQPVQIYNCNGGGNQRWRAYPDGTIRPGANTAYCLDVPGGWNGQGNVLQLWQCWGGINQQFRIDNSGEIIYNVPGGNCLNVQGGTPSPGNPVQLYPCNGGANELWHLSLAINGNNGLCIESQGNSSLNHTPVIQNSCNSSTPGQQWDYYFYNFTGFN